jgi:methylaspartate mutase sigma subunit
LYGMARIDCADFGAKCQEAGIGHVRLYLGGILVTDPEEWPETEALFKGFGFHRVYPPQTKPNVAISDLKSDLGMTT